MKPRRDILGDVKFETKLVVCYLAKRYLFDDFV
jgi:hypothetical protein